VFFEKAKNAWYNNNNRDYHIKFTLDVPSSQKHLPLGKIGEVVDQIIQVETVYVILLGLKILGIMDFDASVL